MMIYIIVEYIIDYLLLIQTSFQVFESVVHEVKQENTIRRSKPVSTVFLLHRISEEFLGLESGCDISATINAIYTQVQWHKINEQGEVESTHACQFLKSVVFLPVCSSFQALTNRSYVKHTQPHTQDKAGT